MRSHTTENGAKHEYLKKGSFAHQSLHILKENNNFGLCCIKTKRKHSAQRQNYYLSQRQGLILKEFYPFYSISLRLRLAPLRNMSSSLRMFPEQHGVIMRGVFFLYFLSKELEFRDQNEKNSRSKLKIKTNAER